MGKVVSYRFWVTFSTFCVGAALLLFFQICVVVVVVLAAAIVVSGTKRGKNDPWPIALPVYCNKLFFLTKNVVLVVVVVLLVVIPLPRLWHISRAREGKIDHGTKTLLAVLWSLYRLAIGFHLSIVMAIPVADIEVTLGQTNQKRVSPLVLRHGPESRFNVQWWGVKSFAIEMTHRAAAFFLLVSSQKNVIASSIPIHDRIGFVASQHAAAAVAAKKNFYGPW